MLLISHHNKYRTASCLILDLNALLTFLCALVIECSVKVVLLVHILLITLRLRDVAE